MKTQVILRNLQWLGRHNPAFTPGSVQTAVAELLNPTSSILPYSAHLLIGRPTVAGSGRAYFNIEASKTKKVNFKLAMPTAEGTYPVYFDIFSNDQLLIDYRADEDVVIEAAAPPPVYTCPTCGAKFASGAELVSHIETAHPPTQLYRVTLIDGSTRIVNWEGLRALMVTGRVRSWEKV
ncbi:hypothetical protein ES708_00769 [subsurface metagenome]